MAGGTGSRLHPLTLATSKHLLPVFSKPMIYYPFSTLLLSGATEILVVLNAADESAYKALLGDGRRFGVSIEYAHQQAPLGIADGIKAARDFIGGEAVALILGDNILYGSQVGFNLKQLFRKDLGATVFSKSVPNPQDYGVVEFNHSGTPVALHEKPTKPVGNSALTGLYFYDSTLMDRVESLRPSRRGELEITDVNSSYLSDGQLEVVDLPRGTVWIDAGSIESLQQATDFVRVMEERQGLLVSSPEEIAWRSGLISRPELEVSAKLFHNSSYGNALKGVLAAGFARSFPQQDLEG